MTSQTSVVKVEAGKKMSEPPQELESYTSLEACDSCGSQAYYRISFDNGHLFFCRHHYLKNEEAFFESAKDIVDESDLLVATRS